jgi:UDP-glucose 4-epimerase
MILITGGLGFIGSHTTRALLDLGESCVLAQRHAAQLPVLISGGKGGRVVVEQVDVTNLDALRPIGQRYPITGIVHLAGAAPGAEPLAGARAGTEGLFNVLRVASDWPVRRVGVASTIGVYGGVVAEGPLHEDLPLPLTAGHLIPASKKVAELLADFIGSATGLDVYSFRIGAAWGPLGRPASRFFAAPQLVHAAARGQTPPAPAYADDGIDMIYAKDCGRAIALLQLAEGLNHPVYNVASGRATSNKELAEAIEKVIPGARTELRGGRDPAGSHRDVHLDLTRIRQDVGFQPAYDTEQAVADYVGWLQAGNER